MLRRLFLLPVLVLAWPAYAQPVPLAPPPATLVASPGTSFSLHGRLSVRRDNEAYHGTLDWQHTAETDDITLTGPFGQGVADLKRNAEGALLRLADGSTQRAESMDVLASRLFGAQVPVATLMQWLRGIAPLADHDAAGRPVDLKQTLADKDWHVEWPDYMDESPTALPRLVVISTPEFGLRIRIDEWGNP